MNSDALGRLTRVELRDIWNSEASDFTPWLAREENLSILGETLDIILELEAQEKAVGPFRADILCKDIGTGAWVLVEYQLERTDHVHLGQLLTYASGLAAVTIIWISARFTEEHRSSMSSRNRTTGPDRLPKLRGRLMRPSFPPFVSCSASTGPPFTRFWTSTAERFPATANHSRNHGCPIPSAGAG